MAVESDMTSPFSREKEEGGKVDRLNPESSKLFLSSLLKRCDTFTSIGQKQVTWPQTLGKYLYCGQ